MQITDDDCDALHFALCYARLSPTTYQAIYDFLDRHPKPLVGFRYRSRPTIEGDPRELFRIDYKDFRDMRADLRGIDEARTIGAYLPGALNCAKIEDIFTARKESIEHQIEFAREQVKLIYNIGYHFTDIVED